MLGLIRRHRATQADAGPIDATPVACLPAETSPPAASEPGPATGHVSLLQRWMSLAEMQQRVIKALGAEIARTSTFVETEADALSEHFQRLAQNAQQQTARVDGLTALAMGIDVQGKTVRIDEVAALFEGTLSEVVSKILLLSKDSMSMVYALDVLGGNVEKVAKCNAGIDGINSTLNMLALNARIEGERAGSAGAAFRVVAKEVYELSRSTQSLATTMKSELKAIADSITNSHGTLKRVATIDMSDNILVKERLEILLQALVERNSQLETLVSDAVRGSEAIAADVVGMVTGIQFQDRAKQRLDHVIDTLQVIDQALDEIRTSTTEEVPGLAGASDADLDWVRNLLSRYSMSEMRERFLIEIIDGKSAEPEQPLADTGLPSSTGLVELF